MGEFVSDFLSSLPQLSKIEEEELLQGLSLSCFALKIEEEDARALMERGLKETIVGALMLEEMGVLTYDELNHSVQREDYNSFLLGICLRNFHNEFIAEYTQQIGGMQEEYRKTILNVIEKESQNLDEEVLVKLVSTLVGICKGFRENKYYNTGVHAEIDSKDLSVHQLNLPIHRTIAALLESIESAPKEPLVESVVSQVLNQKGASAELYPYANYLSLSQLEPTLKEDLLHTDSYVRKQAASILKFLQVKSETYSENWSIFWDLYECLNNYGRHLVEGVWPRIDCLELNSEWLRVLYARASMHENSSVKKYIAKHFMQSPKDSEFCVDEFVKYLGDPSLYGDARGLVGKSSFGSSVSKFYTQFFREMDFQTKESLGTCFILAVKEHITYQVAFRYFLEAIANLQITNKAVLESFIFMNSNQVKSLPPFQKKKAFEVFQNSLRADLGLSNLQIKLASQLPGKPKNLAFDPEETFHLLRLPDYTPRELAIFIDCSIKNDKEKLSEVLSSVFSQLKTLYTNPYVSKAHMKNWLEIYTQVLYVLSGDSKQVEDYIQVEMLSIVPTLLATSFTYLESIEDLEYFTKAISASLKRFPLIFARELLTQLQKLRDLIPDMKEWQVVGNLKLSKTLLKQVTKIKELEAPVLDEATYWVNLLLKHDYSSLEHSIQYKVAIEKWEIVCCCCKVIQPSVFLVESAKSMLDCSSEVMVPTVFKTLKRLTPYILSHSSQTFEEVCETIWNLYFKSNFPINYVKLFLPLAFNSFSMKSHLNSTYLPSLFEKVLNKGKEKWALVRCLVHQCVKVWFEDFETLIPYKDYFVELALFEEFRGEDSEYLLPCSFAVLNFPKPHIKGDNIAERGQYVRVLVLKFLNEVATPEITSHLALESFSLLVKACKRKGELPNSDLYKTKVRLCQLLCSLTPKFTEELANKVVPFVTETLLISHVNVIRQYLERIAIQLCLRYTYLVEKHFLNILKNYDLKPQAAASVILIIGAQVVFSDYPPEKCFEAILPFALSNTAHIRRIAHFVLFKVFEKYPLLKESSSICSFLFENKDCIRMRNKLEQELNSFESLKECSLEFVLSGSFNKFDEIVHTSLIHKVEEVTKYLRDERDLDEVDLNNYWLTEVKDLPQNSSLNYQRKMHDTQAILEFRTTKGIQKRHELILVASLVDKLPNIAGLTRTSEVFNLQMITVPSKNILNDTEYKGMSVTAEKWIPIMEVTQQNLEAFLKLQRQSGYTLVGLEQTAHSISIEKFEFPPKAVLVLGKEKEGIPSEVLQVLDFCVEIPQFGMIRSLNVHVSGSICIWEYIKQNIIASK